MQVRDLHFLAGKTLGVMGLGRSGLATIRALSMAGVHPVVWDDSPSARTTAQEEGFHCLDISRIPLKEWYSLIWSPGIAHTHPQPHKNAEKAKAAGIPVICDVELYLQGALHNNTKGKIIGISGTNGKSTTTTLLTHILNELGWKSCAGGNLGTPALELPLPFSEKDATVLELSSYQIELINTPLLDSAALLNITPDHLDRHGGMEGYIQTKMRLFSLIRPKGHAIISVDTPLMEDIAQCLEPELTHRQISLTRVNTQTFSASHSLENVRTLRGIHNAQNAAISFHVASLLDQNKPAISQALNTYPGLAHRQQYVGTYNGVTFINDSKATNADAAEKALVCYKNIYWILGGQAKEGGIDGLSPLFNRIRHSFLIGEAAQDFASVLEKAGIAFTLCNTLDVAVSAAYDIAKREDIADATVLLSPACASWDQFQSFEHRGDVFIALVNTLRGEVS